MMNLNYQIHHNLYQICETILVTFKKHNENNDNPSIRIYVNKIENQTKTGYYLELLTPEIIKLTESSEDKIIKDKNGQKGPHLEIKEVVLVHCNIVNNDYQQDARVLYTYVTNKSFGVVCLFVFLNQNLKKFIYGL